MRQRWRQKLLAALTLFAVLVALPASSYASVQEVTPDAAQPKAARAAQGGGSGIDPQYVNASRITADLAINGSNAHAYASAIAKRVCRVTVTMRLQYNDNGTWKTKVSWVGASTNGCKTLAEDFTLTQRGQYRTYAIFDVGGENLTYKSVVQRY